MTVAPGKFSKQQLEHYTQDNSSDQMQMVALRAQEVKDLYVIPIFFNKQVWALWDSNPRPSGCKPDALNHLS